MTPEEARRIVQLANRAVDAEWLEAQQRARQERLAATAAEASKKSVADLIAEEWESLEKPQVDGWNVGRA